MASTAQSRIASVLFDYKIVSGAESRVANSIDRTRGKFRQLAADAKAVDIPFGGVNRAAATLAQRLQGTTNPSVKETSKAFKDLRRDAEAARKELEAVDRAAGAGLGGTGGGGLRNRLRGLSLETVGRQIVDLPSVQLGPVSSNDLGQAARGLGAAGVTFSQIAATMAPVVAIAAPLAAGYVALNASLSENKRVVDAATSANQRYYQLIASGAGSSEVEAAITATQRSLEAAKAELKSIEDGFAAGFSSAVTQEQSQLFGRLAYGLMQLSDTDDVLTARADELRQTVFSAEADLNRMQSAIDGNALAAQDAAIALQRAAEAERQRRDALFSQRDLVLSADLQGRQEARSLSSEAAAQLLDDLRYEYQEILNRGLATLPSGETNPRFLELAQHIYELEKSTIPAIKVREREELAIERGKEAAERFISGLETLREVGAETAEGIRKSAEAIADSNARIRKIDEDFLFKRDELMRDHGFALAELERTAGIDRTEAAQKAADELNEIDANAAKERERITRRANATISQAVGERDALAAHLAAANRDEELRELEEDGRERKRKVDKQLADQNRAIDDRLREQTRLAVHRHNEQVRAAALAAARLVADERAKQQALVNTSAAGSTTLLGVHGNFWNNSLALARDAVTALSRMRVPSAASSLPASSLRAGTQITGPMRVPAFALGGITPVNRAFLVGEKGPEIMQLPIPSRVYSNEHSRAMMGGNTININGVTIGKAGMTRRQTEQAFYNWMGRLLDEAGW